MSSPLFIRTILTIPGAGTATHVAELHPLGAERCRMARIVEVDPSGRPTGAAVGDRHYGMDTPPQEIVPHPDTYGAFPDVSAEELSAEEFRALWARAVAAFPGLDT
ncbi:hypothetical protein H7347_07950 [Corynebacterium sp. zg-331]|uniref:hypothetical protein n=1 Tax=unclassified Corynebacterium TaxID=2624378 RepID=UPI00128C13BB|nr:MULTISPECIES: hypothetical protein [unclassified Corynebacterium]MBC3186500.1 hypothetical protein [Corynebacterium sp. zg-331]MPV52985.1 hypothetical protein [Corynebacterium sp. zg331]